MTVLQIPENQNVVFNKQEYLKHFYTNISSSMNRTFSDNLRVIKKGWEDIWENDYVTPAEALAALGKNAVSIFQLHGSAVTWILSILSEEDALKALPLKYRSAGAPYTAHEDGSITLAAE